MCSKVYKDMRQIFLLEVAGDSGLITLERNLTRISSSVAESQAISSKKFCLTSLLAVEHIQYLRS